MTVYKRGYSEPVERVLVKQARRTIGPIAYSDTITIPKAELRLELKRYAGVEKARLHRLIQLSGIFACRWQAEFDDMLLLLAIRDEIISSPIADQKILGADNSTPRELIERKIKEDQRK
jgi:hypothetical protein